MRIVFPLILDNSLLSHYADSLAADSESLSGVLFLGKLHGSLVSSGDLTGLLGHVELDVTVGGQVW